MKGEHMQHLLVPAQIKREDTLKNTQGQADRAHEQGAD